MKTPRQRNHVRIPLPSFRRSPVFWCCLAVWFLVLGQTAHTYPRTGAICDGKSSVEFRTWAPSAKSVSVGGTFNGWNPQPMDAEPGGFWSYRSHSARPGDMYKFKMTTSSHPDGIWKNDPRAFQIKDGNSVIVDHSSFDWGPDHSTPKILPEEHVVYEMHVGAFNDAFLHDGRPATFDSALARLGYLSSLGVNVIALMPTAEFEGDYSWGYNPTHPFAVESAYGEPDALKRFVKEAHLRGMKVQLDLVHNHYSAPPDSLWNFDGPANSYFYSDEREWTPWGSRPNYDLEGVSMYVLENAAMWLDDYKVDGLRWDSPQNILAYDTSRGAAGVYPPNTLKAGRDLLASINVMVSRYSTDPATAKWSVSETPEILPLHTSPVESSPAVGSLEETFAGHWQPLFHEKLEKALNSSPADLAAAAECFDDWKSGPGTRIIFTDNHDKAGDLNGLTRLSNRLDAVDPSGWNSRKKSLLALTALMTAPGIPMLLSGQEVHATGAFSDQSPFDWVSAARNHKIFRAHQDAISLRHRLRALRKTGEGCVETKQDQVNETLFVWRRMPGSSRSEQDDVVAVFNMSTSPKKPKIPLPSGGTWYVHFNTDWNLYSPDFGSGGPPPGAIESEAGSEGAFVVADIAPLSALVISRSPSPPLMPEDGNSNGLPDSWEIVSGIDSPQTDEDTDGIPNIAEFALGTAPLTADTVACPGTPNNWDSSSSPMTATPNGTLEYPFVSSSDAPQEFKFLVNGKWWGVGECPGELVPEGLNIKVDVPKGTKAKLIFWPAERRYALEI